MDKVLKYIVAITLLLVAILLGWVLLPFGVLSALVYLKITPEYLYRIAVAIDQMGNVVLGPFMNEFFIKKKSLNKFGSPDETISSVIGKNKRTLMLTPLGDFIRRVLNMFEKDHSIKAIEEDEGL